MRQDSANERMSLHKRHKCIHIFSGVWNLYTRPPKILRVLRERAWSMVIHRIHRELIGRTHNKCVFSISPSKCVLRPIITNRHLWDFFTLIQIKMLSYKMLLAKAKNKHWCLETVRILLKDIRCGGAQSLKEFWVRNHYYSKS